MISCPECRAPIPPEVLQRDGFSRCARCEAALEAFVFPAYFRPPAPVGAAEKTLSSSEASCFYHPEKQATIPCGVCGRFLCALCDMEVGGVHYCPGCLERSRHKKKLATVETERTLHGKFALTLALLPVLLMPVTIISAPITIVYSILQWNKPQSLVAPGRRGLLFAIILGAIEIVAWLVIFILASTGGPR